MVSRPRKRLLVGFAAVAVVLTVSSAAFACVRFKGKAMIMAGNGHHTVIGDPAAGMAYCEDPGRGSKVGTLEVFTVAVRPQGDGTCVGQLVGGTDYILGYGPPHSDNLVGPPTGDCLVGNNPDAVAVGTMTVGTDGVGSAPVVLPPTAAPGPGAICITHPAYTDGHRVPIFVV